MIIAKIKTSKFFKKNKIKFNNNDLFNLTKFRDILVKDRYFNITKKIKFYKTNNYSTKNAIDHNAKIQNFFYKEMSIRPDSITNILSSISSFKHNIYRSKILLIGARTEAEIFSILRLGVPLKNIFSIDLFSTSKLIRFGDVCNLNFKASTFDIVICGWVLEFIKNYKLAIANIKKVSKPKSIICIGGMVHPKSMNLKLYNSRINHYDRTWYISYKKIKKLFNLNEKDFIFKDFVFTKDRYKLNNSIYIFNNKK